jgi:hypothetical protein
MDLHQYLASNGHKSPLLLVAESAPVWCDNASQLTAP